jgi:hypothetical protein
MAVILFMHGFTILRVAGFRKAISLQSQSDCDVSIIWKSFTQIN